MKRRFTLLLKLAQDRIEDLVGQDELTESIELLFEITQIIAPTRKEVVLILAGRLSRLEKEKQAGLLEYSTLDREKGRITASVLDILTSLSVSIPVTR